MLPLNGYLPEGWTSEELPDGQILLSTAPVHGGHMRVYATVDFAYRGFRSGLSQRGPLTSRYEFPDRKYEGRGWKDRLVSDAVAWLQEVMR